MRIGTLRTPQGTTAVCQDGETVIEIEGYTDAGALLQNHNWREIAAGAAGPHHDANEADFAPVVENPGKIICVGANYRTHILEMGSGVPKHPTLFAKFADSLIGPQDRIKLPEEDDQVDWEAELALVIGAPGRRISEESALSHVAGFTVLNDISMRGYQFRTNQWLQGKTWEKSTPLGPVMVTPDAFDVESATIRTMIDGEIVQESNTADLLFGPQEIIAYVSTITTLRPGDIIATGTPDGVGFAQKPQRFIREDELVETTIDGIGALQNKAER